MFAEGESADSFIGRRRTHVIVLSGFSPDCDVRRERIRDGDRHGCDLAPTEVAHRSVLRDQRVLKELARLRRVDRDVPPTGKVELRQEEVAARKRSLF
jgi:hypothetical protein